MKKMISFVFICVILFTTFTFATVNDKVTVKLNNEDMVFDVEPIIENGRTMIPFRAIFEELGAAVSYREENGKKVVIAYQGSKQVRLKIGDYDMDINGKTVGLEVAPKILNGRTIVPLRAVSEALDAVVEWDNDTRTVMIFEKLGQYEVSSYNLENILKADDGTILININAIYPVIESKVNDSFVDYINKSYLEKAENYMVDIEKEYYEDAKIMYQEMGKENYSPMEFSLSYEIDMNRANLLSITALDYRNANGAHPSSIRESRTFQMLLSKELSLTDVFDVEQEVVDSIVYDKFLEFMKENDFEVEETNKMIKDAVRNVEFYLADDALVMYFNQYEIGPYALGFPTVVIPFSGPEGIVKLDLSGANLEKLEFENVILD